MAVGAVLGTALNIGQEILRKKRQGPVQVPEKRLYFACIECALFPIGLFWWAWTGKSDIHWIVPSCGVCCATIGIYTIFLAVNNYTADTYQRLASSALAAQSLSMPVFLRLTSPICYDTAPLTSKCSAQYTRRCISFSGGIDVC